MWVMLVYAFVHFDMGLPKALPVVGWGPGSIVGSIIALYFLNYFAPCTDRGFVLLITDLKIEL